MMIPALGLALAGVLATGDQKTLDDLLARARHYLEVYEDRLTALVADEQYEQRLSQRRARSARVRLQAHFMFLRLPDGAWMGFRDVYTVNGRPVRPRDDRLAALLVDPQADVAERASAIVSESARYQLGPFRTINVPLLLLDWLKSRRVRLNFFLNGIESVGRDRARRVDFEDAVKPTIIQTLKGEDVAARGSFWIAEDGRILQTELVAHGGVTTIRVTFAEDPRLQILVPSRMTERVRVVSDGYDLHGQAVYRNYRRFETTARLKP